MRSEDKVYCLIVKSEDNLPVNKNSGKKIEYLDRISEIFIKELVRNKLMPQILGMVQHQTEWK